MVNGKCIAMSTTATIHSSMSLEDSSSKDSEGDSTEQTPVGLSWDASCESFVTLTDNGSNGELAADLWSIHLNKTKVTLTWDITAGTNNRVAQNSTLKRTGQAYLTDLSITAANRTAVTGSFQFTGDGPLS